MDCPLDYSLCDQTVTLYRKQESGTVGQVLVGCAFSSGLRQRFDTLGTRMEKAFLLIVPGQTEIRPGDLVLPGVGPAQVQEIPREALPITQVRPYYWNGMLCHTEAEGSEM